MDELNIISCALLDLGSTFYPHILCRQTPPRMCPRVSISISQIGHRGFVVICRLSNLSFIGKVSLQACHRKVLTTLAPLMFQISFHSDSITYGLEKLPSSLKPCSLAMWYALCMENFPFLAPAHTIWSRRV